MHWRTSRSSTQSVISSSTLSNVLSIRLYASRSESRLWRNHVKAIDSSLSDATGRRGFVSYGAQEGQGPTIAAEQVEYKTKKQVEKAILEAKRNMEKSVKEMDFIAAAHYRDEMLRLKSMEEGLL